MEGFISAALAAFIVSGCYFYFKKTDNLKLLMARMAINIVLALFCLVGMIVMLATIDDDYKWFSFLLFIPIIALTFFLVLDGRRLIAQKEIEERRNILRQKELQEKRKAEKLANDKDTAQQLLEQCGMKFFLKYYKLLIRLPLRDIEVEENYTAEEKSERLAAGKAIIEQGFSLFAAQHILDNYSDLLTDDEKAIANGILLTK